VETDDGDIRIIRAGDVSVVRPCEIISQNGS